MRNKTVAQRRRTLMEQGLAKTTAEKQPSNLGGTKLLIASVRVKARASCPSGEPRPITAHTHHN